MSSSLSKLSIRNNRSFKPTKLFQPQNSVPRVMDSCNNELKNKVKTQFWVPYASLKKWSTNLENELIDIYYPFRQLEVSSSKRQKAIQNSKNLFDLKNLKDQNIIIYQKIVAISKENYEEQKQQRQQKLYFQRINKLQIKSKNTPKNNNPLLIEKSNDLSINKCLETKKRSFSACNKNRDGLKTSRILSKENPKLTSNDTASLNLESTSKSDVNSNNAGETVVDEESYSKFDTIFQLPKVFFTEKVNNVN